MGKGEIIGTATFALLLGLVFFGEPGPYTHTTDTAPPWARPQVMHDLGSIRRDTLRVLVLRDPLSWEERPGAQTGLEWDLLRRFAKREHLAIKAVPVDDPDTMLLLLQQGRGDVMAAQLMPQGWASRFVHFTKPYRQVAAVKAGPRSNAIARRKKDGPPVSDTLMVSRWSPFLDTLGHLVVGDSTWLFRVDSGLPEEVLACAAIGQCSTVLTSDATASMEAKRLPLVDFKPREGRSVPLVFGVRTNAPKLLHALDTWLADPDEKEARLATIAAYDNGLGARGPVRSFKALALGADTISPYDSLFQVHADSLAWDWKLLAAVAYKESRFDTAAVSHKGAGGLMQMMPATAAKMGVERSGGVDSHIRGASRYLAELDGIWRRSVPNGDQRLKFVLASYNAGPGHILDAQRLAKDLALDPHRWDGNVERALVLLNRPRFFTLPFIKTGVCRGQDTYWYVRDVMTLFSWLRGHDARLASTPNAVFMPYGAPAAG